MRKPFCAVLVTVLLAGCSVPQAQQPDAPTSEGTGTSEGPSRDWDPKAWEPTVTITRPSLTEDEKDQTRKEVARQFVTDPELLESLPDVPVVAYYDSFREQEKKMAECMTDAGFSAKALQTGGLSYGKYPELQERAFQLAGYTCQMQFPFDPALARDWSAEQVGLVYDYWNEYMIPCLEGYGYATDVSKRPSRESYVQNFFAEDGSGREWFPTDLQPALEAEGGHDDVLEACPALPASDMLYGVALK
ncbi:hypothetical protein HMPREF3167_08190 [Trueperella sp. HMSC08B05]|uniref:hypothetical protein n=1 Tax=Trueperella sp. HMSC08B05 TaxID=1581135 RepID=UPI0008A31180|nr:hypothetical protein [Trueperella sp. HMSC08B05]OFS72220.1 hypothetical protein HMPREF3167_08190 [Trueperella sp. HMSC08B05]